MGESTSISWTDHTFNPWWGCTRVSPGCENCYAETFDKRVGGDHWGPGKPRRVFSDKHWLEPLKWDAKAAKDGVVRKMFCASMADIFDAEAPEGQRDRLWDLCRKTPHLVKQLLTKRAEGYARYLPDDLMLDPLIWKGVTAENQEWFEKRWPYVACLPGVRWISYEPALGPLLLDDREDAMKRPDWIVCGGESGNGFRPINEDWARDLRQFCSAFGIKFFMKQMSARTPKAAAQLIPVDMLVREFPA